MPNKPDLEDIDLKREGLLHIVRDSAPSYSAFEEPLVKRCGSYIGGFHDKWEWNINELKKLSNDELKELYNIIKDSWS